MPSMAPLQLILAIWLVPTVLAVPAPTQPPEVAAALPRYPNVTPPPALVQRDIADTVGSYIDGVLSSLGSDVSSYVASGIPEWFENLPTGTAVESSLSISDSDLAATPTQVLNLPAYGNWTQQGWNVRVHGNVFKQPNISQAEIDNLANVFLIGTNISSLPPDQQAQARNVTEEIYVVQQANVSVTVNFVTDVTASGGIVSAAGGGQTITLPYNTTDEGDFDTFVVLQNTTGADGGYMIPGSDTASIQALNMYIPGTDTGNATAYLVPTDGITVVSDIDDILRVTQIYDPTNGLLNTFTRPFTPWLNMPDIYANWSASVPNLHFHYLTTTPEQVTRNYMEFIYNTYPLGSFDTRPLNFSDVSATLAIRRFLLDKIFQTFPQRKFILVADTSNSDVMKDYPAMYTAYPGQVLCIFLRNTSSTDPLDRFPYDTSGFKGIPQNNYMFFNVPDDLKNLDIVNAQCYNSTIKQNVTFGEQGLPFGLGGAGTLSPPNIWSLLALVAMVFAAWL